jgi:hypothetical protein
MDFESDISGQVLANANEAGLLLNAPRPHPAAERPPAPHYSFHAAAQRDQGGDRRGGGTVGQRALQNLGNTIPKESTQMLVRDYVQQAEAFLDAADAEISSGDGMQGSEKLWGAATQVVIAAAQQRDWPYASHSAMRDSVRRLASEHDAPSLQDWFLAAEHAHVNFYHGFMDEDALEFARQRVHQFVVRMLELIGAEYSSC